MFSIKTIMGRDPSRVIQEGEVHTISYSCARSFATALRVAIHANHEIAQRYLIAFRSYKVISSYTLSAAIFKVRFEDFQALIDADGRMIAQIPFGGGNVEPVGG